LCGVSHSPVDLFPCNGHHNTTAKSVSSEYVSPISIATFHKFSVFLFIKLTLSGEKVSSTYSINCCTSFTLFFIDKYATYDKQNPPYRDVFPSSLILFEIFQLISSTFKPSFSFNSLTETFNPVSSFGYSQSISVYSLYHPLF